MSVACYVSDWRGKPAGRAAQRSVRGLGTESTTPAYRGNAQKNRKNFKHLNELLPVKGRISIYFA